jgi:flagellar hook-basal body complex protein FliE
MTPIAPISAIAPAPSISPTAGPSGIGGKLVEALESVARAETEADRLVRDVASGGPTSIHELMVATTKASLSVEMLAQLRNRAVEAYQEIMRMQV